MMLRFTADHEWLRIDGDVAVVGITEHAQEQLGDLVFVELPASGKNFEKARRPRWWNRARLPPTSTRQSAAKSSRRTSRSSADPTIVNSDPLGNGWFFKLKIADPSEIESLMDEKTYKAQLGSKV